MPSLICDRIAEWDRDHKGHAAGAFSTEVLRRLEQLLPAIQFSAETGCGKSTILFSNVSKHHTTFCLDDRPHGDLSSVRYFESCPFTQRERINVVFGPTQVTLRSFEDFQPYDVVLIDGPHGYPFPEMEYYAFYPHIRPGGLLIVDDVHIATIGRLADFIAEDPMFAFVELVASTAVFRRTDAAVFDPLGDGWWLQDFNRRRIPGDDTYARRSALVDGRVRAPFASSFAAPAALATSTHLAPAQSSLGTLAHRLRLRTRNAVTRVRKTLGRQQG